MFVNKRRVRAWKSLIAGLMVSGGVMGGATTAIAQTGSPRKPEMKAPEVIGGKKQDQKWAILRGMVIDSVNLLPLVGATVLLDGTTLSATTDNDGKFEIDSIPPGDYRLAVFHPLLDTIGFSIGTEPLRMGADSIRTALLGTPSSQTLVLKSCPATKRKLGEAAVMGRVLDPDTDIPLAGVRVTMVWTKVEVSTTVGYKRTPQMREAVTDSSGSFLLCGVSPDIRGTIQAERGDSKTAEVELELLGERVLAFQDLRMLDVPLSDTAPTMGEAILSGRVVDKDGVPIADAKVSVQGTGINTPTGDDGRFRMVGLPSGTRAIYVHRLGYLPNQKAVNLSAATPAEVNMSLKEAPPMLDAVVVEGKFERALKQNGFLDRKRSTGGRFYGPKDLDRMKPFSVSNLFQRINGFKIEQGLGGSTIKSTRASSGCVTIWVDDIPYKEMMTGGLDTYVPPDQLVAVEAYSPVNAPMQYKTAGQTTCSVIVIWTNRNIRETQ